MSFENASVIKGLIIYSAISSIFVGIFDVKHYFHLQFVPHISKHHQYWRLISHHLAFSNSSDLLVTMPLLYNTGVHIERQFGSVKFASFVFVSLLLSTLFEFVTLILFHSVGINHISMGSSAVIFSVVYQYSRIVPPSFTFKIFGISFSDKSFNYLLALQIVISRLPSSAVVTIIGILTGQIYRSDLASFNTYRLPPSVVQFSRRFLSPLIGSRRPPRRSNRALPDEFRSGGTRNNDVVQLNEEVITTARSPRPTSATSRAARDITNPGGTAPSVMREWVDGLTGRADRASVGLRVPTETEISTLTGMFPTIERESVVGTLQRSPNIEAAVETLLASQN